MSLPHPQSDQATTEETKPNMFSGPVSDETGSHTLPLPLSDETQMIDGDTTTSAAQQEEGQIVDGIQKHDPISSGICFTKLLILSFITLSSSPCKNKVIV